MSTSEDREKWADIRLDTLGQAEEGLRAILVAQGCVRADFEVGRARAEKLELGTSARTDVLLTAYAILRYMPVV